MRLMLLLLFATVAGQTIQEKREGLLQPQNEFQLEGLEEMNRELEGAYGELRALYAQAVHLGEDDPLLTTLLGEVQRVKREIAWMHEAWREQGGEEGYALWHQPWTTVEKLVMEYGSADHIYLIPPDVGEIPLTIASDLPVPRAAWEDLLSLILSSSGISIEERGPLLRRLYRMDVSPGLAAQMTTTREALEALAPHTPVCHVLSPAGGNVQAIHADLWRIASRDTNQIHLIGRQIFVACSAEEALQILKLYEFVTEGTGLRGHQFVNLEKMSGREMEEILRTYFKDQIENGLLQVQTIETLPLTLFVTGHPEEIELALQVVADVEGEIHNPRALTTFTYVARHTDAGELADLLHKSYCLMTQAWCEVPEVGEADNERESDRNLPINPTPVTTAPIERPSQEATASGNFVVDPKTGTIVMVIEEHYLPEIQTLIRRLDVPKKMVRIEVMLVEKRLDSTNRFGLDLLRIGAPADNVNTTGFSFDSRRGAPNAGLVQFLLGSAKRAHLPKFDLLYDFLLTQENLHINSNPSVTTVNHSPATIELVEEISIDNGTFIDPDFKENILRRGFTRTQYGITIQITPNINESWVDEAGRSCHEITLETDVLFDTPLEARNDRPPVIRRHITNEVRVGDGETVVLGGLRSKRSEDDSRHLPFIGELPGIGKFFSSSTMRDQETEMFIFITPRVIEDPSQELERMQQQELCRRPGDLPEFLSALDEAGRCEERRLFSGSLQALFGRPSGGWAGGE